MLNYLLLTQARLTPAVPRTWPDAYLDHWGDVYLGNPALRAIGITFEMFLQAPEQILGSATFHTLMPLPEGHKFYPLLPAQRAVQERVDAEAAGQMSLNLEAQTA
jgi:hypothetical protein